MSRPITRHEPFMYACYPPARWLVEPVWQPSGFELTPGTRVGQYEVMRKIAVGGMAEIYLVRVTGAVGFEKVMVLKRILPRIAEDAHFVRLFLNEARLAATLRHPNIADVLDVGEWNGSYFFTMEYVHGEEVRAIRRTAHEREENVPLPIALAIVQAIASALHYCHSKLGPDGRPLALVHRDVSSNNVMVGYDGAIKLLDFGLARVTSETHETQSGALKGKVPYMSPEQCRCLPLDRRSDLFSLGVIFYELTVGRRPFRGENDFALMEQIIHGTAQPPSALMRSFPPDLEAMVMRLLARAPEDRYPTADELVRDLDEFIAKHGQWASARAIVRYMRSLFASDIEAWEHAQEEGIPFAEHIATTITSDSARSVTLTPPPGAVEPDPEPPTKLDIPRRSLEPIAEFKPMRRIEPSELVPLVKAEAVAHDAARDAEAFVQHESRTVPDVEPIGEHELVSVPAIPGRHDEPEAVPEDKSSPPRQPRALPPPFTPLPHDKPIAVVDTKPSPKHERGPVADADHARPHEPVAVPETKPPSDDKPIAVVSAASEARADPAPEPEVQADREPGGRVSYPVLPATGTIKLGRIFLAILVFVALGAGGVFAVRWLQSDLERQQQTP